MAICTGSGIAPIFNVALASFFLPQCGSPTWDERPFCSFVLIFLPQCDNPIWVARPFGAFGSAFVLSFVVSYFLQLCRPSWNPQPPGIIQDLTEPLFNSSFRNKVKHQPSPRARRGTPPGGLIEVQSPSEGITHPGPIKISRFGHTPQPPNFPKSDKSSFL